MTGKEECGDDEMESKARTRQTAEAKDFKIYFKNNRRKRPQLFNQGLENSSSFQFILVPSLFFLAVNLVYFPIFNHIIQRCVYYSSVES